MDARRHEATDARRRIPQVERLVGLLSDEGCGLPRPVLVQTVRTTLDEIRRDRQVPDEQEILQQLRAQLSLRRHQLLLPVINATGVVLHTNLGRAPLSAAAIDAVVRVAGGYSNLELDLQSGSRGSRYAHVEPLLALATGAEAALVVNNNAAAVLLVCAALAAGRKVVISRGELIEIGGQFRIPEVIKASGAILTEVGTTNRTHVRDYDSAVDETCGLVLKVHPSNYRVVGFTASPSTSQLAKVAHACGVPLVYDAGSGLVGAQLGDEPAVDGALADGADLVCFSGDKLLGGPQAGIICGRRWMVDRLRSHPLVRALRPDKMCLAALQATVAAYLDSDRQDIPVWRMLHPPDGELEQRCVELAHAVRTPDLAVRIEQDESVAGGGSLPGLGFRGPVVRIRHSVVSASTLADRLRAGDPPVVARIHDDELVVDLRTVARGDDDIVAARVLAVAG